MDDAIRDIRTEIRRQGFLSATQISVRVPRPEVDMDELLNKLECDDIQSIQYANSFVGPEKRRKLFYYNVNKRIR